MAGEPILGKREPTKRDYRPLTWEAFLALREWAKEVAAKHRAAVYLVGSALHKVEHRDVDLAIVLPASEVEKRIGPMPPKEEYDQEGVPYTPAAWVRWYERLRAEIEDDIVSAHATTGGRYTVDVKLCPDTWWPDKDRLLLAGTAPADVNANAAPRDGD